MNVLNSNLNSSVVSSAITDLNVNGDRLLDTLKRIGSIGALPNNGVRRLAFSPEDIRARQQIEIWMEAVGMTVNIDTAGNIIGRYPGHYPHAPALATGSHLDTVPNAGIYDGTYGVLAGLEVVRTLHDNDMRLDHPLEVIIFADEERTMIGSKAMAGQANLDPDYYAHPHYDGIEDCVNRIGGRWSHLTQAQRTPHSLAAFVELHVEQGPVMESCGAEIGLVTGIVGQRRYIITVEGAASHAGTTPMSMRQDALVAAAQVILAVHQIGNADDSIPFDPIPLDPSTIGDRTIGDRTIGDRDRQPCGGDQVATVGAIKLSPNVANTIPGSVELSLDMRDLSNDYLDHMIMTLERQMEAIATATQTQISLKQQLHNDPVPVHSHIYNTIAQVCQDLGLMAHPLPSRASHDAQIMASVTDMGMIFVPSEGGISHAETEYTSPEHCIQGTNVLLHTLLQLDQHYRCPQEQPS